MSTPNIAGACLKTYNGVVGKSKEGCFNRLLSVSISSVLFPKIMKPFPCSLKVLSNVPLFPGHVPCTPPPPPHTHTQTLGGHRYSSGTSVPYLLMELIEPRIDTPPPQQPSVALRYFIYIFIILLRCGPRNAKTRGSKQRAKVKISLRIITKYTFL